jgi:hypothetical protein
MSPAPRPVVLERDDAQHVRDVLEFTGRYLRNPYRRPELAAGFGAHAAEAAALLTRHLSMEEDH